MNYFELIMNIFKGLWSLKNLRLALIFKGQDYAQTEGGTPINDDNDAWLALPEEERNLINNNPHLKKHWDKSSLVEKIFYIELKRNNSIGKDGKPTTPARTQSEEFLDYIKNLKYESEYFGTLNIGKYIGWSTPIIDICFSPTFGRIVGLIAAVAIMFTPLGYTAGAIGMSLALVSLGYDLYRYVSKYRKLNRVKEERVLLEEIKKVKDEIQQSRSLGREAFDKVLATSMPGASINPYRAKPSFLDAALYVGENNFLGMAVGTVLSVTTLSPYAIMASMFMMITGYGATSSMYNQFNKRFIYLQNANSLLKAELGLEGVKSGHDINYLRKYLSDLRCYNLAVKEVMNDPETKKASPNTEYLRYRLAEAFQYHTMVSDKALTATAFERPSFLTDTWTLLKEGVSWVNVNRRLTPSFMEAEVVNHHSNEIFESRRRAVIESREVLLSVNKAAKVHPEVSKVNEPISGKRKDDKELEREPKRRKSPDIERAQTHAAQVVGDKKKVQTQLQ